MNSWLHYFGLDSAKHWDALLFDVLSAFRFPGASASRATALEMFGASHIAPSTAECPTCCGLTLWIWFGTFWWVVGWADTRTPQIHWFLASASTLEDFRLEVLLVLAPWIFFCGKCQMLWRMANLGRLHVLRNWLSPLRLITPCTCCMKRINYASGSLMHISWTSFRSDIHMCPLRVRPTKSTLNPRNTIILTGWVSIIQQDGRISPGSFSCFLRPPALLREMPLPCICSLGWAFDWNEL